MQKLITIYLNNENFRIQEKTPFDQSHGFVEQYLDDYLSNGWEIKLINSIGGSKDFAWIIVLLEKP